MNTLPLDRRLALPAIESGLELLGSPLTGYQIDIAARISEPSLDGLPGAYRHPVVCILAPRQVGKTITILTLALGRARKLPDYRAAYAAQTGHITSQRFKEWTDFVRRRPGWHLDYKTRDSDGTERITVRRTHSYLRAFPPLPGRLRSSALDLVVVDEAQEHDDAKLGQKLDADIQPVFDTRPRGQWIIAGTAGDLTATYWRRHYLNALNGAPGHLLIEIGTPPEGADLDDPAVWAEHHPGVRSGRTTIARLEQARATLGPDRFAREYLNHWSNSAVESIFPPGSWRACHVTDAGIDGPVSLALEVPPDRDSAVILAAGQSTANPTAQHVELVAMLPIAQAVAAAAQLTATYRVPITVDPMSPAVTLIEHLKRARIPVHAATGGDVVTGSLALFDRVTSRTLTHLDQAPLSQGAVAAQKRKLGSRWAFDRYAPGGALIMGAALAGLAAGRRIDRDTPGILHA